MSSLKPIKWIKIVLTFLTVPLVFLSLLSVEKSAAGSLTSKAYARTQQWENFNEVNQWSYLDNYTVYAQYSGGQELPDDVQFRNWVSIIFNGYSGNNYKLEYNIEMYKYNTNTKVYESGWVPVNTLCYINAPGWSHSNRRAKVRIYVRRDEFDSNNERRWLTPSDMRAGGFNVTFLDEYNPDTLPSDWFATTTQTVVDPLETYTTIINGSDVPDYDDLDSRLEVPHDVEVAVLHIFDVIGTIMSLKYMTFLVCFSIVMGLLVWLLH